MKRSLLDTDMLSYYLKGWKSVVRRAEGYLKEFGKLDFSIVTYYEVLRGLKKAGATRKLETFEALADRSVIWHLDRRAAQKAAEIHAELTAAGTRRDDADILIASIALVNDLVVVTNNTDHFSRIAGIELDNWLTEISRTKA